MPKRYYDGEEEDEQPIDLKIYRSTTTSVLPGASRDGPRPLEAGASRDGPQISNDEIRNQIIKSRSALNMTQLQLNQKCKFQFKYTIRDIESGKSVPTLTEKRAISIVLGIDLK